MTPKEKAKELFDKFNELYFGVELGIARKHWAKQSALIAFNEIDDSIPYYLYDDDDAYHYWLEVKEEIHKL